MSGYCHKLCLGFSYNLSWGLQVINGSPWSQLMTAFDRTLLSFTVCKLLYRIQQWVQSIRAVNQVHVSVGVVARNAARVWPTLTPACVPFLECAHLINFSSSADHSSLWLSCLLIVYITSIKQVALAHTRHLWVTSKANSTKSVDFGCSRRLHSSLFYASWEADTSVCLFVIGSIFAIVVCISFWFWFVYHHFV